MRGLIRRNRRPTVLRRLVSLVQRQLPPLPPPDGLLPSHHIFAAGLYSPVFARLAAEAAWRSCPPAWRTQLKLYIHVDGVPAARRPDILAWLREAPGVEVSYGLFGILPFDRIPGKWHQVMVNDTVRRFGQEARLAFLDADLFLVDDTWWQHCVPPPADPTYALSLGLRHNSTLTLDGQCFAAMKTQLFTLDTALHRQLITQRFNKDARALDHLRREFPQARIAVNAVDTQIVPSLQAQARGHRVIDLSGDIAHCHVGGYSHLKAEKFRDHANPARRASILGLLGQARLLPAVLATFDRLGWGRFVDPAYRHDVDRLHAYLQSVPALRETMAALPPAPRETAFAQLTAAL